jgi:formylglycine-generating enzyme required for sulfatase activity
MVIHLIAVISTLVSAAPNPPEGMVYVHPGTFMMGEESDRDDAVPVHKVEIKGFFIDKCEVTVAQFGEFVKATGYVTDAESAGYSRAFDKDNKVSLVAGATWIHPYGDERIPDPESPVTQVSWHDAVVYCSWAGKRLPTEAEWEYAARNSDGRLYPWGNQWDEKRCSNTFDSGMAVAKVGSFPGGEGPFGTLDQAGNVWEWCQDYYQRDYYAVSPVKNPLCDTPSGNRVLRGGSFTSHPVHCKSTYRYYSAPEKGYIMVGFRCAKDVGK